MSPEDLGVLGPYRVINELGRGGMGFVFRAEDTRLKRIVALKVMNEKIAATPHSRSRFVDEARSMAAVKHDNVATIYEVNDQCTTPFMAMEMLKGGTLEDLTRRHKKFDYHQVIHYAIQTARGLAAAHAQGIVHRDIKPANIWIEAESDRVKILDFGLALVKVPVDQLAGRGSVIGTPQYLSPEQARSEPLDDRSDLYSLGVVLFELCTGDLPFKARSVLEQLILTLVHTPPLASEVNSEIPKPLAKLIAQLLEKEPRLRPRGAIELEKMLDKVAIQCEANSDVALTINKLQEQLNRVAIKPPAPPAVSSSVAVQSVPPIANPFEALPIPPAIATRGLSPISPLVARDNRAAKNAPRPTSFGQARSSKTSQSNLPGYWSVVAIGATAVLLLFVVFGVFLFSSRSSNQVTLIAPAPTIPSPSPLPALAPQKDPEHYAPAADKGPENSVSASSPELNGNSSSTSPQSPVPESAVVDTTSVAPAANVVDVSGSNDSLPSNRPMIDSDPIAEPTVNLSMPSSTNDAATTSINQLLDDPSPAADEVLDTGIPAGTPVETVRTSSGKRGADTTVKRASRTGGPLGENHTVVVQTRGKVDVQHAYLRFDLESLKKESQAVGNVELVLSLPGAAPAGSTVRVYGVPEEYSDEWLESGPRALYWDNSTSKSAIEDIPLLAEAALTGDETTPTLRIHDPRLTDFIQSVKEKVVTLVLAGGSPGDKALHFVSREGSQEQAPSLDIVLQEKSDTKK